MKEIRLAIMGLAAGLGSFFAAPSAHPTASSMPHLRFMYDRCRGAGSTLAAMRV